RWEDAHTVAAGIRVPKAVGDFLILRAVRESCGKALAVDEADIIAATAECAAQDGLLICPEGGATLAAYRKAVAKEWISPEYQVVLFNCATGLKYPLKDNSGMLDKDALPDLATL
ncbi:MAG TPA: threonine synthase, partial [Erythrobacter sp.]|nr:threonine synthase [Erythrobacter sp.]